MINALVILLVIDRLIKFFGYKVLVTVIRDPSKGCEWVPIKAFCIFRLTPDRYYIDSCKLLWYFKFYSV
jgi:hypothetical protein